jgi:hypothetical protein
MPVTNTTTPATDFTLDVVGRYVCNTFGEARDSQDASLDPDARPFDFIIIGGGTFASVLATHLLNRDKTRSHRVLVLEAGKMVFTEHVQNQPMLTRRSMGSSLELGQPTAPRPLWRAGAGTGLLRGWSLAVLGRLVALLH